MTKLSRLGQIALGFAIVGAPALAEPTANEACLYFANFETEAPIAQGARTLFGGDNIVSEQSSVVQLDRYQTIEIQTLREIGIRTQDNPFAQFGNVSAALTCIVDIKERRVLTIFVSEGPRVGEDVKIASGSLRKVEGAKSAVLQIGLESSQGKY